ncbi:hypothetical protein ACP70R_008515 [Stipagrostis hirtigluma subsp. patula]
MTMPEDRLSELPDDLLRRVLFFAPAREGAATAVLSRRWRTLWRTSGAVNLDSRSYGGGFTFDKADRFLRDGEAALAAAAAAGGPVRRLTFHVEEEDATGVYVFLRIREDGTEQDMVADVVRSPAARRVEELHIRAADRLGHNSRVFFELDVGDLPSKTLRMLHVGDSARLTPPPPGTSFRLLADLRLTGCAVSLIGLQRIVDAAPQLTALHLESSCFHGEEEILDETQCYRLLFPAVTALVFADCDWPSLHHGLELEAPELRYFRYKGTLRNRHHGLSLKPQVSSSSSSSSSNLSRVDLHVLIDYRYEEEKVCVRLWQFVQNFSATKVLKLKLEFPIDHIAIAEKKDQEEILGNRLFHNLERLELQGWYEPKSNAAATAIGNLLYCCPVARDLRLSLIEASAKKLRESSLLDLVRSKDKLDFDKSVNQFRLHRRKMASSLDGDGYDNYEVPQIPGLSEHSFSCLRSYLRRVSLEFHMGEPNCFGVQLAKFFAKNAIVLQEMHIDDGNHKMWEHMNHKIERWVTNSSRRRNLPATTNFRVLPYETLKRIE